MIWFILSSLCVIWFIFSIKKGKKDDWENGWYAVGIIIPIIIWIVISIGTLVTYFKYQHRVEKYKIYQITIKNKIKNIKEIRKAFIESPAPLGNRNKINNTFAIDMVNKDLTKSLSDAYKDLELYIKEINDDYALWEYKYNNRIWTTCYIKPVYDAPLNISDYFNEQK